MNKKLLFKLKNYAILLSLPGIISQGMAMDGWNQKALSFDEPIQHAGFIQVAEPTQEYTQQPETPVLVRNFGLVSEAEKLAKRNMGNKLGRPIFKVPSEAPVELIFADWKLANSNTTVKELPDFAIYKKILKAENAGTEKVFHEMKLISDIKDRTPSEITANENFKLIFNDRASLRAGYTFEEVINLIGKNEKFNKLTVDEKIELSKLFRHVYEGSHRVKHADFICEFILCELIEKIMQRQEEGKYFGELSSFGRVKEDLYKILTQLERVYCPFHIQDNFTFLKGTGRSLNPENWKQYDPYPTYYDLTNNKIINLNFDYLKKIKMKIPLYLVGFHHHEIERLIKRLKGNLS